MAYVTEENLTDLAIERWSNIPDPRLRQVMTSLVKHLHAFVREVRQELAKVTWPSRKELTVTTASVLGMSAVAALFFFLVDQILGWAVRLVLGLAA